MARILSFIVAFMLSAIPAGVAFAVELQNPLGFNSLAEFLRRLLGLIIMIGYPVIVLFIVYIGFQYIQAQGNPEKLKTVHKNFLWALVGALIVLGAQALAIAIQATVTQLSQGV